MTEPDDSRRFTEIYHAHHRQVYAYAVSRAGRDLADDIVADTFLVVWRRLDAVPPAAQPWLLGVARNVIRERYRSEVRQASIAAELRAWTTDATRDFADGVADRAALLAALGRLDDSDRELLTLVAWQGLTTREAARVVGCSAATYLVRLHRARKRLAQALTATAKAPRHLPRTLAIEEPHR